MLVTDTCIHCHLTCVMPHHQEREKSNFFIKKGLKPLFYFGHNKSILTQNELKFQVEVHSDKIH